MIAQVFTTTAEASPQSEDMQKWVQEIAEKQRAVDGCEGIYILGNPTGNDTLSFVIWRDEAAMKAASDQQAEDINEAKQQNRATVVDAPKVYAVVASA